MIDIGVALAFAAAAWAWGDWKNWRRVLHLLGVITYDHGWRT